MPGSIARPAAPARLRRRSLAYVRALDAGAGERVPLLHEVVEAAFAINPQALINIELKGRRTAGPVAEFLRALPGDLRDHFLVSSFHRTELRLLRGFGLRLGILFARSGVRFRRLADALQAWSVHLPLRHVTARAVERIHAHGQKVFVYTVNAPRRFRPAARDGRRRSFYRFSRSRASARREILLSRAVKPRASSTKPPKAASRRYRLAGAAAEADSPVHPEEAAAGPDHRAVGHPARREAVAGAVHRESTRHRRFYPKSGVTCWHWRFRPPPAFHPCWCPAPP